MNGTIARKVTDKGFGFIRCDGKDYFFHTSGCRTAFDYLEEGDKVEFDEEQSPKGARATNVRRES